jgi:crotonobetainyl-CoA:carnitine CoA-transferase CaiB-like acyl-CoA transferase
VLKTIGWDDLVGEARFPTQQGRNEHAEEIYAMIEAWAMTKTKYEAMEAFGTAGILVGATLDSLEVLNSPHLKAREMIVTSSIPHVVRSPCLGHLSRCRVAA